MGAGGTVNMGFGGSGGGLTAGIAGTTPSRLLALPWPLTCVRARVCACACVYAHACARVGVHACVGVRVCMRVRASWLAAWPRQGRLWCDGAGAEAGQGRAGWVMGDSDCPLAGANPHCGVASSARAAAARRCCGAGAVRCGPHPLVAMVMGMTGMDPMAMNITCKATARAQRDTTGQSRTQQPGWGQQACCSMAGGFIRLACGRQLSARCEHRGHSLLLCGRAAGAGAAQAALQRPWPHPCPPPKNTHTHAQTRAHMHARTRTPCNHAQLFRAASARGSPPGTRPRRTGGSR